MQLCEKSYVPTYEVTLNSMGNFERFHLSTLIFNKSATQMYFWKLSFCGLVVWLHWIVCGGLQPKDWLKSMAFDLEQICQNLDINIWCYTFRWRHDPVVKHVKSDRAKLGSLLLLFKNHLNFWVFNMRYIVCIFHIFANYSYTVRQSI